MNTARGAAEKRGVWSDWSRGEGFKTEMLEETQVPQDKAESTRDGMGG